MEPLSTTDPETPWATFILSLSLQKVEWSHTYKMFTTKYELHKKAFQSKANHSLANKSGGRVPVVRDWGWGPQVIKFENVRVWSQRDLLMNRQTHTTENITFQVQTSHYFYSQGGK